MNNEQFVKQIVIVDFYFLKLLFDKIKGTKPMLNPQILFCLVTMFGNNEEPEVIELSKQTVNEKQTSWQLAISY